MTQQVWFVTGSTRGFGRALVTAALHAGDAVAATARRPEQLSDLKAEFGDRIVPIAVDVTDAGAVRLALQAATGPCRGGNAAGAPGLSCRASAEFVNGLGSE